MTIAVPPPLKPLLAPIDSVRPAVHNPRSGHAVDAIARSLEDFGWHAPIVARAEDGEIIIGHGRLEASKQLGLKKVPVLLVDDDKAQAVARMVADNRLTELSDWDLPKLDGLLEAYDELADWKDDLDLDAILADLPGDGGGGSDKDPDDTPPEQEVEVSKPGDVWALGRHRLVCGDSTDVYVVEKVLDGAKPALMVTDPPYGVDYDAAWREEADKGCRAKGKVKNDDRADWEAAEMEDRRCFAVELNPAYVDMAIRRWQEFTGLEAVDSDGASFEERERCASA